MIKLLYFMLTCLLFSTSTYANKTISAAENVINRLLGSDIPAVQWEVIPTVNNLDVYETLCENGQLIVRGSSSIALCRGFYDYLRSKHLGMVGWEGARLKVPEEWPDAPLTRVETPFRLRHSYNAVTAGYTFPYWTWERWEQELDWLAMHGYNMIMAPVATEAIATRVWKEIGFTQREIDSFYVGPAHLPWLRMGCIKSVGGTLPPEWHYDQLALQHKILTRMRELGIEFVVQGFAGFVPDAINRLYPEVKSMRTLWNAGFPLHQRPKLILPDEPLFKDISQAYIREWRREFGDARYYLVDSFNELRNLEASAELFCNMGRKTYEAVRAGDPEGTWVIQGWMFSYQRDIWTHENVQALFSNVPSENVLILDYANDYNSGWDHFEGFYGKPWLMGYVPNMGGKTAYTGNMQFYAEDIANMLSSPLSAGNVGITLSGEGLENNQVLYELISEIAWSGEKINLDKWMENYSMTRYGSSYPEEMKNAWEMFRKSCYGTFTPHPTFGWQNMRFTHGSVNRDSAFISGVQSFLACRDNINESLSYRDDALEMAAIALSLKTDEWFIAAKASHDSGDTVGMDKYAGRALQMLLDIDRLLESHSLNRLDRWLSFARKHQGNEAIKDFYEHNARQIITIWGPPVNDYSARLWSGLIRDFYQPRMKAYLNNLKGKPFDRHKWEQTWVESIGISKIEPFENPVEMAAKLVVEAYSVKMFIPVPLRE